MTSPPSHDSPGAQAPNDSVVHNDVTTDASGLFVQAGAITGDFHYNSRQDTTPVPRQMPPAPGLFTGREQELAALSAILDPAGQDRGSPTAISILVGAGGIGKTWLALHWAHRYLDRFPGGQLFADLRGFSPGGQEPQSPSTVVRGFLEALGVEPSRVPAEFSAQVGLYRSLIIDKRMLIMLDNVGEASQITPLLPGGATCAVIVTSRVRLSGLITAYGAQLLPVGVLSAAQARDLLARRVGKERLVSEPEAATELIASCAGLPLALSIVAGRAVAHPGFPLALLADELRHAASRMGALDEEDPSASLPGVLSWSYTSLTREQADVFGLLGLAPGPDISLAAAGCLTGLASHRARTVLRRLDQISLLEEHNPGRWRMHDLVGIYATEQGEHDLPKANRQAALQRLVGFYTHTAHAGHQRLSPHSMPVGISASVPECRSLSFTDHSAAIAWFVSEHPCLMAAQSLAVQRGWHDAVWHLAWALTPFHWWRGHTHDDLASWQVGLAAANHLDATAQARAYRRLGDACSRLGHHTDALEYLQKALALTEKAGDVPNQAHTHRALSRAEELRGDSRRALEHGMHALRLYELIGNPVWKANALSAVGWCSAKLGNYSYGDSTSRLAIDIYRCHHDRMGEAVCLMGLGYIAHQTGQLTAAVGHYQEALALFRNLDITYHEAVVLERLGLAHAADGAGQLAGLVWRQACELYRQQHRTDDEARVKQHLDTLAEDTASIE